MFDRFKIVGISSTRKYALYDEKLILAETVCCSTCIINLLLSDRFYTHLSAF